MDKITDPGDLGTELNRLRAFYNGHQGCTRASATSPLTTNTKDEVRSSEPHDEQDCAQPTKHGLPPDDNYDKITNRDRRQ